MIGQQQLHLYILLSLMFSFCSKKYDMGKNKIIVAYYYFLYSNIRNKGQKALSKISYILKQVLSLKNVVASEKLFNFLEK